MKTNPHRIAVNLPSLAAVAAIALCANLALAQPASRVDDRSAAPAVRTRDAELKRVDRTFLERAARAGLDEVEISRVAAERTSNPEVRRFAQAIISDHEDVHEELAALAALKGVNLPAKDAVATKWTKRDAKNFDRDYIGHMVSSHDDTVKLFEKHAREGEDPETVAFARKHLAKLQQHLHQATDLQRVLKDR